jgi:microcystin-dependent protein
MANEPLIGAIFLFAGEFAPTGYQFCNGQVLPVSQYAALFSIPGTTYGGNGTTTFACVGARRSALARARDSATTPRASRSARSPWR